MNKKKTLVTPIIGFVLVIFCTAILLLVSFNPFIQKLDNSAFAITEPVKIEHNSEGEIWLLPDGQKIFKVGGEAPPRKYQDGIIVEDGVTLRSNMVEFDIQSSINSEIIFKKGVEQVAKENWFIRENGIKLDWNSVSNKNLIISEIPIIETVGGYTVTDYEKVAKKERTLFNDFGSLLIEYKVKEAHPLKHTLTFTATKSGIFSVCQELTAFEYDFIYENDVDTKIINKIDTSILTTKSLDVKSVDSLLLNETQKEALKADIQTALPETVEFRKDGVPILTEITSGAKDVLQSFEFDAATNTAMFCYGDFTLNTGESFVVDPDTYTSNNPTEDGMITSNAAGGSACPTGASTRDTTNTSISSQKEPTINNRCITAYIEWPISSIPDSSTITNSSFKHKINNFYNAENCEINPMTAQPSTNTDTGVYDDARDGTPYVADSNWCTTTDMKDIDLGTSADSEIQSRLTNGDWFAIGIWFANDTRGTSDVLLQIASEEDSDTGDRPTLEVTYTDGPLNPPTNLSCTSVAQQVQCSWTPPVNATFVTGYYFGRSLDNSTFTNKTSIGNVTSMTDSNYWRINQLYYANLTSTSGSFNSTTSAYTSFTTDTIPSAPQNPTANGRSDTSIIIRWDPPNSDGNDPIIGYKIDHSLGCTTGWTTLVNATNTSNYNHTNVESGQEFCYRMGAWNGVGLSDYTANFTGSAFALTTGNATLASINTIGDTIQLNTTIAITTASPSPVTVSRLDLYANSSLTQTYPQSAQIAVGDSQTLTIWYRMLQPDEVYDFLVRATISNATGTVTFTTNNVTGSQEFEPDYVDAIVSTQGDVSRVGSSGVLKVNRINVPGNSTWQIECFFKDWSTAFLNGTDGTWINTTNVGAFETQSPDPRLDSYATCYNEDLLFFDVLIPGNFTNYIVPGLVIFDQLGGFLGAPSVLLFILAIFSWGTGRNFPIVITIGVSALGLMSALGLLILSGAIWGIILVIAGLAIFGVRKFF